MKRAWGILNPKSQPITLVVVLALVGFLLVVTGSATSLANQSQEPRKRALINQILDQQQDVDDLDQAVAELRQDVDEAQANLGQVSQQQEIRNREQGELALQAGMTALKGSGIVVKLSDAPKQNNDSDAKFDSGRIQDSDIQLIVNALFAAGAEAVAINDNRVVAVTPIRAAGGTIVVNYRPVSSPYRIVAIGADLNKFNASEIADHFRQWKKKFNLGYSVDKTRNGEVPAYSGRVGIDIAAPSGAEVTK